ncbi:platelet-activating factor acetylhydrolase-like, partial [Stegodyphus dumicola]|uniref:platelet-activating factor acetylhydrolase-like n=1 Tax=Stegodyphus dumicola TaxID=202533 RepID=UPI0015B2FBA9
LGDINIPAAWDAPPLRLPGKQYPVVIFSHGLGGCRTSYTTFCLELASQGYVVAALEHRDYSACMSFFYERQSSATDKNLTDHSSCQEKLVKRWMLFRKVKQGKGEYSIRNQQVHHRAKECSLALNILSAINAAEPVANVLDTSKLPLESFKGMLNLGKVSVAGHSFGGATVIATMATDKRFKAGLGLDTWMLPFTEETSIFRKVQQPMLFINMEKFQTRANLKVMKMMESTKSLRVIITLKGTVHLNQCDVPFLCDKTMRRLFGAHSNLNRFTAMNLTTALSNVFLSKQLGIHVDVKHDAYILNHRHVLKEGINVA